jgi:hypothetical protein
MSAPFELPPGWEELAPFSKIRYVRYSKQGFMIAAIARVPDSFYTTPVWKFSHRGFWSEEFPTPQAAIFACEIYLASQSN